MTHLASPASHPASVLDGAYSWTRLAISLAVAVIGNVGMWAVIVVLPAVQAELGLSRADASLPYTATMVGFALGNLVIGRMMDRRGAPAILIGAALLLGLSYWAATLGAALGGWAVWWLTAVHLAIGFGSGASFGPLIADISHWFSRRRGLAVAIAASGNYLSGAIWPLVLAGTLAEQGWREVYLILAVLSVVLITPLALLLRRRLPAEAANSAAAAAEAARARTAFTPRTLQWLLIAAGIGCCLAMAMPQVHIVALCVDLGFGPAAGAQMLSLMLVGGVISRLVSGVLADRLGGVRTLLIGSIGQALALFLYLPFDGLTPLYVVSFIFGLSQGGIIPSYAVIVREYMPPKEAGARVGAVIMATIVGMALGGWASGLIHDLTGSYRVAFLNGIAWNFVNIAIVLLILSRSGPRVGMPRAAAA